MYEAKKIGGDSFRFRAAGAEAQTDKSLAARRERFKARAGLPRRRGKARGGTTGEPRSIRKSRPIRRRNCEAQSSDFGRTRNYQRKTYEATFYNILRFATSPPRAKVS